MTIDEFVIKLGIDPSALQKGAAVAKQAISNMMQSVKNGLSSMASSVASGIGSIFEKSINMWGSFIQNFLKYSIRGLMAGVGAAFAFFVKDANRLGEAANKIGVTVETLSTLENAVKSAGGSTEELEKDMKSLAEETGGNAYGALKELAALADEMGAEEYTSYAEALGLSQTTIDLTKDGTQALKNQIHAAKELGIINRQDAKDAKELKRALVELVTAFRSLVNIGARMVIPGIKKVAEAFKNVIVFLRKNDQFVKIFFIGLATVITATAIPAIIALTTAMLASPFTWMIAMVAGLALALDDLFTWMDEGEAYWAKDWEGIFGDPKNAREKWEEFSSSLKEILPDAIDMLSKFATLVGNLANPFIALVGIFKIVGDAWDKLKDLFLEGIGILTSKFNELGSAIEAALEKRAAQGRALTGNSSSMSYDENGIPSANGGIFDSPTHTLVGEAGAEAIIPFSAGKRNRGLALLSKIAGNLMPNINASQALPMGGATTVNNTTDTRVNVGTVNISAADGTDAANQFMSGIESRASAWTAAANVAY